MTALDVDGRVGAARPSLVAQWMAPSVLMPVAAILITLYVTLMLQTERLEALRVRLADVERDYQRRDVLAEQLRSIDGRLYSIEIKLGEQRGAR